MRFVTSDPRTAGLAGRIGDVVHYVTGGAATALLHYGNGATEWIEATAEGGAEIVTADPRSGGLVRPVGSRVLYVPVSGPPVSLYRYSSAASTDWCTWSLAPSAAQPLDSDLTAIAALSTTGLVERTGSGTAAIRALGVGASTSVPTRADADSRYAAASHTHAQSDITNLTTDLAAKAPLASPTFTGTATAPSVTLTSTAPGSMPSAPSSGYVLAAGLDVGGRQMLAMLGPTGAGVAVQPHIGTVRRSEWIPFPGSSTTPTAVAMANAAVTGTPTGRPVAAGSIFTAGKRTGAVSSGTAGQSCGFRAGATGTSLCWLLGDVANAGGFHLVVKFGVSDAATVANSRMFVGFTSSTSAIGNVEPSSLTNIIGVGCDAGETNLSIIHNDGSGTATKVSLGGGSNYPSQTLSADVYQFELYAVPNASTVTYRVSRLGTSNTASGTLSSDLPSQSTLLAPQLWRNNGSTALAVGIDLFGLYIESDL